MDSIENGTSSKDYVESNFELEKDDDVVEVLEADEEEFFYYDGKKDLDEENTLENTNELNI